MAGRQWQALERADQRDALTAHLTNGLVASVQWQKPYAPSVLSNTFMRTTLSGEFDHARRDFKYGAQLEMYY